MTSKNLFSFASAALLAASVFAVSFPSYAQQGGQPGAPIIPPMPRMPMERTITVLAGGEATAAADRVTLGLTVSSADPTATGIFVKQDDIIKHLKEALQAGGIEAEDITVQPFHLMPNMEYGQNGTRIIGYRMDTPLELTLDNPKDLPRVIDLATQNGASSVSVEGFGLAPGRSLHTEAIKDAIGSARKEADTIAKEMGKSVGDIVSISETGAEDGMPPPPAKGGEEEEEREQAAHAKTQQAPSNLSEHAELRVVFEVH